jgi:hypothetical protein
MKECTRQELDSLADTLICVTSRELMERLLVQKELVEVVQTSKENCIEVLQLFMRRVNSHTSTKITVLENSDVSEAIEFAIHYLRNEEE